jgi:DNA polymerase-3 subunit beta
MPTSQQIAAAAAFAARSAPQGGPVQIRARGGALSLSCDGWESEARAVLPWDGPDLVAAVQAGVLASLASLLPPGDADIALEGASLRLSSGRSAFRIPTMPPAPETPGSTVSEGAATPCAGVLAAVAAVAPAAAPTAALPVLTGISWEAGDDGLWLAATDRYRLAARNPSTAPMPPAKGVTEARRTAAAAKLLPSDPAVAVAGGGVVLEAGGMRTALRGIEGDYPAWRTIPGNLTGGSSAVFDPADLAPALRRASASAAHAVLRVRDGEAVLEAAGDRSGATDAVPCTLDGPAFDVQVNAAFLADGLRWESCRLSVGDPARPFSVDGGEGSDGFYILMPIIA